MRQASNQDHAPSDRSGGDRSIGARLLRALLACVAAGLAGSCAGDPQISASADGAQRPNVVIVLADDLGFNDVGYNGSEVSTPRLDGWVGDAVRFSHFYSNVVCSPTRAGLMTGRWPIRFGMMRGTVEPGETYGIPASEETIAEAFERGGYPHRAIIGKWHLGDQKLAYFPTRNGFSYFFGHVTGGLGYFVHERDGVRDLHRNLDPVFGTDGQYLTHMLADEAVQFIGARGKDREPFLLYFAPYNPHQPNETLPEYIEANKTIVDQKRRTHAGMTTAFDTAFGRVMDALEAGGLSDNTLVVFMSDNGGDQDYAGANVNSPLRGEKATVFEGGVRVPAALRWPAAGYRGGRVVGSRVGYIDVMPTALAAAAIPPGGNLLDGANLLPVVTNPSALPARDWFAYIGGRAKPRSAAAESLAVFHDGWKLVRQGPAVDGPDPEAKPRYFLFRIDEDPNETNDLAVARPEIVADLRARMIAFRALEPDDGVRRRPLDPAWKAFPNWTPPT